jgi:hypothetical protein
MVVFWAAPVALPWFLVRTPYPVRVLVVAGIAALFLRDDDEE